MSIATSLGMKDQMTNNLNQGIQCINRMRESIEILGNKTIGLLPQVAQDINRMGQSVQTLGSKTTSVIPQGTQAYGRMSQLVQTLGSKMRSLSPAKVWGTAKSAISGANTKLNEYIQRQSEAAKRANEVKGIWSGIGKLIKSAMSGFNAKMVMDQTDTHTRNTARIGTVNDGSQSQGELQKKIYQAAQRSGGSYQGMVDSVPKLGLQAGNAFSSNDEMIGFAELMNKSFAVSGADPAKTSTTMDQITKAMAAGKLSGDEFAPLMESAPMLVDAISKYTGKSKDELKIMSSQGLITADIIKASLFSSAGDIEQKFSDMPKTFKMVWSQIKNFALMAFGGVMEQVNGLLNSATGERLIGWIMTGISKLAMGIGLILTAVEMASTAFESCWGVIGPVLTVALPAVLMGVMGMLFQLGMAALISGLQAAAGWIAVYWPLLAIGAVIGLVIVILQKMGVSFDQITGFIGGVVGGLFAFLFNIVAAIWNFWASFVEFFANCFNHRVYSVKRLFVNLANTVLDVVKRIAEAIDAVTGSKLADGISGLQEQMNGWLGETPKDYKVVQRLESKSILDYADAGFKIGVGFGAGLTDEVGNLFGANPNQFGGDEAGVAEVGRVGEVGRINGDVNIADEDIKLMKDVAEMRYVQNFVTLTPTISQNIGTVNQNADVDYLLKEAGRVLREESDAGAEGSYA